MIPQSHLWIYAKEISILKICLHSHVHCDICHNSQNMEIILYIQLDWQTLWLSHLYCHKWQEFLLFLRLNSIPLYSIVCVFIYLYVYICTHKHTMDYYSIHMYNVYTHKHAVEYYSALKNDILPRGTTRINLEDLKLNKIFQT